MYSIVACKVRQKTAGNVNHMDGLLCFKSGSGCLCWTRQALKLRKKDAAVGKASTNAWPGESNGIGKAHGARPLLLTSLTKAPEEKQETSPVKYGTAYKQ